MNGSPPILLKLVYVSSATAKFSPADLAAPLEHSRRKNSAAGLPAFCSTRTVGPMVWELGEGNLSRLPDNKPDPGEVWGVAAVYADRVGPGYGAVQS